MTVTDNGIGFRAAEKKKQANSSLHKSVGMTLTRKRLELLDHSGKEENVVVEELTDEKGKVNGTRVMVWIRG